MNLWDEKGPRTRVGRRIQCGLTVMTAVLLLSVQIGLACHAASHLHHHDVAGDCGLCVLSSQLVAEALLKRR